jgi:hypothetical protein
MEQSAAMLFALEGSRPYGERLAGHLGGTDFRLGPVFCCA